MARSALRRIQIPSSFVAYAWRAPRRLSISRAVDAHSAQTVTSNHRILHRLSPSLDTVALMTQIVTEALLEPRFVGDITGRFFVPAYQRGYRWGSHEVGKLLDDIWEHVDAPYYLQPVVVKQRDDEWELVDGQQRLTTLFLILQFMEKENLQSAGASYDIRYETRENSASYLRSLDPERREENIDFYHLFAAQQKITEWFQAHGARRQHVANKIYGALFDQVRVIWYQADDSVDATTLFQRLNVGRIPLTDAELIKAQLLTRSKGLTGLTDRDLKIAGQWD